MAQVLGHSPRDDLRIEPTPSAQPRPEPAPASRIVEDSSAAIQALITAYRLEGWRVALLDPLDSRTRERAPLAELDPRTYGLAADNSVAYRVEFGGLIRILLLPELLSLLERSYCGTLVLDCTHVRASEQRRWLYARLEALNDVPLVPDDEALRILGETVSAEAFEHFRRAKYPQYKQFSLEGGETLVTLLRAAIEVAARHGVEDIVLGMPHRGRLNLMLNALDVPLQRLFSLYSAHPDLALAAHDLRDHAGLSTRLRTDAGEVHVLLAHNPSHLESVSPVVCGMARALQERKIGGSSRSVMPLLIHGDASFSGQGVVSETLNLSQTRGHGTGGTLHLVLNNQIGSTVSHPRDARSSQYCVDVARAIDAPVLHVNADDPDAVVATARLATEYRMTFGADAIVDHVGYRRHGHFGADDPTVTQPATQRRIRSHPSVAVIYAEKLAARGVARIGEVERLKAKVLATLTAGEPVSRNVPPSNGTAEHNDQRPEALGASNVTTAVPLTQLQSLVRRLSSVPPRFTLHSDVEKIIERWRPAGIESDRAVDWCLAENLAYATLLANGFNVRLSGLDVGRGSFFHRYHVWHDQAADTDWDATHIPLRHVAEGQGVFSIFETPLSEEAVLGFEYGYSLQCGRDLVVWEAQFGDFVNGAQVIVDQYIASGEAKWGYRSGLVMLLPHGDEGGGPEHSCAYLGRFLQLCAERNLEVAMPSTAAQMYHLLRRHALAEERKPMIVMTPKTRLYGVQESHSPLRDLAQGEFRALLSERDRFDPALVTGVVITSGKLCYDLLNERSQRRLPALPILRVEQLYPFPSDALADELRRYPRLREVVWAQEEAKNHGAWHGVRDALEMTVPPGASLRYAGRPSAAPTATCDPAQHAAELRALVTSALGSGSV